MSLVGMMRVKNEDRWIERVATSILPACNRLIIFDDHSTDRTVEICRGLGSKVEVIESPYAGLDEARDKNYLLARAGSLAPEWILHIDGDEEMEPGGCEEIAHLITRPDGPDAYQFQILYLWDREDQIRVDRWYKDFRRPSLFRARRGQQFRSNNGAGFHCGNIPSGMNSCGNCGVRLRHYGYMMREDRIRKYEWYNAPDKQPVPPVEDGYRHMVVGDLFPATSAFRWAGPLELRDLPAASGCREVRA